MNISPSMQRMDSLTIAANIKNLSWLELFYTCVANLAEIMNQRDITLLEEQYHYIEKDDYNRCIYYQRDLDDTSEYQLLIRLLKERTIIDDDGTRHLRKKEAL